jgi:hypothetical protein
MRRHKEEQMKYLKILGLAAMAAMALTAFVGAGTASAETLWYTTADGTLDTLKVGSEIDASLEAGTSAILKDQSSTTIDTCTSSTVKGKVESNGTPASGKVSSLTFGGCSHTTKVIAPGSLTISPTGAVTSAEAEVTVVSTVFGASCIAKTGSGTSIGTLKDAPSSTGHATLTINASLSMGICGTATWTGSYTVTTPTGLHAD